MRWLLGTACAAAAAAAAGAALGGAAGWHHARAPPGAQQPRGARGARACAGCSYAYAGGDARGACAADRVMCLVALHALRSNGTAAPRDAGEADEAECALLALVGASGPLLSVDAARAPQERAEDAEWVESCVRRGAPEPQMLQPGELAHEVVVAHVGAFGVDGSDAPRCVAEAARASLQLMEHDGSVLVMGGFLEACGGRFAAAVYGSGVARQDGPLQLAALAQVGGGVWVFGVRDAVAARGTSLAAAWENGAAKEAASALRADALLVGRRLGWDDGASEAAAASALTHMLAAKASLADALNTQ